MLFRPGWEENLSTRTNAQAERGILVRTRTEPEKGRETARQKKVRLEYWSLNGLGGVRIGGWVPGPQDGNLNLEPHPEDDELC